MAAATYMRASEGFDIYNAGIISANNYPWFVSDAAKSGTIVNDAGAFTNAKALSFTSATTAVTAGLDRAVPISGGPVRANAALENQFVYGLGFWFNATRAVNATQQLIAMGTSLSASNLHNILGYAQDGTSGLRLLFPTNANTYTTSPQYYPILIDAWYWIDIRFAIQSSTSTWTAEYRVNDAVVWTGAMTWSTAVFSAGQKADRLKFYNSSNIDWKIDDLVVRTASSADSFWVGSNPTVLDDILPMTSRRIYTAVPVSNGSVNEWESSDGVTPNYEAATDPTGAKYVVANDIGLTDLYKFQLPGGANPSDISGVVYRGSSSKYTSIQPVQKVGAGAATNTRTDSGADRFIGVSENDGSAPWTAASIAAAEFGQKSV